MTYEQLKKRIKKELKANGYKNILYDIDLGGFTMEREGKKYKVLIEIDGYGWRIKNNEPKPWTSKRTR